MSNPSLSLDRGVNLQGPPSLKRERATAPPKAEIPGAAQPPSPEQLPMQRILLHTEPLTSTAQIDYWELEPGNVLASLTGHLDHDREPLRTWNEVTGTTRSLSELFAKLHRVRLDQTPGVLRVADKRLFERRTLEAKAALFTRERLQQLKLDRGAGERLEQKIPPMQPMSGGWDWQAEANWFINSVQGCGWSGYNSSGSYAETWWCTPNVTWSRSPVVHAGWGNMRTTGMSASFESTADYYGIYKHCTYYIFWESCEWRMGFRSTLQPRHYQSWVWLGINGAGGDRQIHIYGAQPTPHIHLGVWWSEF